ncbi:MBL fold metallo-hydrolase [Marinilabiliaceae bacterium ANBcel2]|nr:MBL fold metallo-hydrolase [Marinilabiliaceae bacterium ANBcel2]
MIDIKILTFSQFQSNCYIVFDHTKEAVIIDPGMLDSEENKMLDETVKSNDLKPVKLLLTHGHLDHLFGAAYIKSKYGLLPQMHKKDLPVLQQTRSYALSFGVEMQEDPPIPEKFIDDEESICFGDSKLKAIHIPGHSPGSLIFFDKDSSQLFAGDVLFNGSIGRTDLPGGDHASLIRGIDEKLMILPDDVTVYCGHGPATTIGKERSENPFL